MVGEFAEAGVRFKYPENWRLEREDTDAGWTASLQSPGTAFFLVSLRTDTLPAEELAESVLASMREVYPELEAQTCVDTLAGLPAVGHDIGFFSLDFSNTCWTRCLSTEEGTLLVMWQSNDFELEEIELVLRAMCVSLTVDTE